MTFQVDLSGLGAGQELDSLAATVVYDDTLLGDPTISPGPIVPNPLDDPLDFAVSEWPGEADATFLTFSEDSAHHITADGVFFSFDVTVLAAGAGQLSFDFVDATEFNSADPFDPILLFPNMGPPLAFTASSVPEPATLLLLACATFFLPFTRSRRNSLQPFVAARREAGGKGCPRNSPLSLGERSRG